MKDKCKNCENTYHEKDDFCRKCEFKEAKWDLFDALIETKIGKMVIRILDWMVKILPKKED